MTTIKQLIKIWEYQTNRTIQYNLLDDLMPKLWLIILTSDGSFTRNISIINKAYININLITEKLLYDMYEKDTKNAIKQNLHREVWLLNDKKKIIFAQSSWQAKNTIISSFSKEIPIGKNLISSEINIHRELQSIYLCYSTQLEKHFQSHGPLWGRSYQIYLDKTSLITINEIFALNNQEFIPSKKIK